MALNADDHIEIQQLLARYNWAVDFGETSSWADCFTPDGIFECLGLPEGAPLGGRHVGRDALIAYATRHFEINQGRARHWNWNVLIDCAEDTATMRCYLNAYSAGQGDSALFRVTGTYRDELVRDAHGWRFARRQVTIDPA